MNNIYEFRMLRQSEVPQMFHLILQRMRWMNENGIKQWNVMEYDKAYPQVYYEAECQKGRAFVLVNRETDEIVCGAVLKEQDELWNDNEPALYLHHFAAKVGEAGAGSVFLGKAEAYAKEQKKRYFRLDSSDDNEKLEKYYRAHGYLPVGICEDGGYRGILREKALV